jgi:uncharacterized membrane protein
MKRARLVATLLVVMTLAYPALAYVGLKYGSPRAVALTLLGLFVARFFVSGAGRAHKVRLGLMLLPPLTLCGLAAWMDQRDMLLYMPVLFSLAFLVSFGATLFGPVSAVEVFARMVRPDLTPEEVSYCRHVTQVWVGFFVINSVIAFWTARWASLEVWGLYNGLITYLIMGTLFVVEMTYRHWRFRIYRGLPTDWLFRKLFPPRT